MCGGQKKSCFETRRVEKPPNSQSFRKFTDQIRGHGDRRRRCVPERLAPDWYLVLLSSLMAREKSVRVRLFPNREYPYSEMCDGATSTNNF